MYKLSIWDMVNDRNNMEQMFEHRLSALNEIARLYGADNVEQLFFAIVYESEIELNISNYGYVKFHLVKEK